MREIKFRGKRLDNGELVYGFVWLSSKSRAYIMLDGTGKGDWVHYGVEPETVSQYTGLKIKTKELYEGDLVRVANNKTYQVKWVDQLQCQGNGYETFFGCFVLYDSENLFFPIDEYAVENGEIIGNIYEKPELLNQLENK